MNVHKVDRGTGGMEIERKSDEIGTRKEEKRRRGEEMMHCKKVECVKMREVR